MNAAAAAPHPQEAFGREPPPVHATPTAFEARQAGSNAAASHPQTQPPPHPQASYAHEGQSGHAGAAPPPANNKPQAKPQAKPHPQTQEGRDEGKHEREAPAEH